MVALYYTFHVKLTGDGYLKGCCAPAANGDDVGLIGFGQGMYGGGRRWIGEWRVGVAGLKDTGGEVTDGAGAQPLGCAGGLDISKWIDLTW